MYYWEQDIGDRLLNETPINIGDYYQLKDIEFWKHRLGFNKKKCIPDFV
jgi:hypothetical protein